MPDESQAYMLAERAQTILKAVVVGSDSSVLSDGSNTPDFISEAGVVEPPYDLEALCRLFEHSNSLRPNIDAYITNVDGFGHRMEPRIDFDAEEVDSQIADAVFLEQSFANPADDQPTNDVPDPSSEVVQTRKRELTLRARLERARLANFFECCCIDQSFIELRRRTRQDLETCGNAYWEILRDGRGTMARLVGVPGHTIRLLPLDAQATEVVDRIRVSPVKTESVSLRRRLRKFVQIQGQQRVYFKELGDPRTISRKSGAIFPDTESLLAHDSTDGPATELLHFAIHSPRSPYGIPRWIGALLSVLGSRSSEEVNYLYFENKSIPPLAIFVSEGRLSESSVPRIERYIEENLKGKRNFHKILILEAEGSGGANTASRAKIELRPLTDAQQQDALFQNYDQNNIDKVGSSFRLPPLLRGESRQLNRATAEAALRFAEDQVFHTIRDEFDDCMNRRLLADMNIELFRFRSQTPMTRDPERTTTMVEKLVRVGVLTPEEGRHLAADIFNREFRRISDDWTKRPITLTLAGIQTGVEDLRAQTSKSLVDDARSLIQLRDELEAEETNLADRRMEMAHKYMETEPVRIPVPAKEFDSWFEEERSQDGQSDKS